ncbi:MAG: hypothetical protein DRJ50_08010 [Actinobacteria bacterium]|nr:MAG: hypothetical protein DRJ50_08010 [Actinomycetota bacterium]
MATNEAAVSEEISELLPQIVVNLRLSALLSRSERELTPVQLIALLALESPTGKGVPVSHLAEKLGISRPATTALADRLADKQLIIRSHDPDDRRIVRVSLSTRGAAARDRLLSTFSRAVEQALDGVPHSSRDELLSAMRQVSEFAQQMRATDQNANS